jgi:flagellar basal-body rod protein FlgB
MDVPAIKFLERFLNVTADRHSVIVRNMANVDTPRYHTQDIDFRSQLETASQASGSAPLTVARSVRGLIERPDGNNVNVDREGLLLAETQIQFRLGIQFIRTEFHRLLNAINEGKES